MKRLNLLLCLLGFILCFCTFSDAVTHPDRWCIAKFRAPDDVLQVFVDRVCAKLDCRNIKPGGSCFLPDNMYNHASYVMNLHYRDTGDCDKDLGALVINDPSLGGCHYP